MPEVRSAAKKKPTKKLSAKSAASRRLKQPVYKSFRVSKRIRQPKASLTGAFRLMIKSLRTLSRHWRLFGGIVLVYLVLTIVLVKGFGVSSDITQLKTTLLELFQGKEAQLVASVTLFTVLLGNANASASDVAGAYQSMLLITVSLALIWALRQSLGGEKIKVTVRDAFYKGLYPIVPFVLVLIVIGLQLLPLLISGFLYSLVFGGGLAVTAIEKGLWIILFGLLVLLSVYMVSSSVFALYIVTLPDIRPMVALRSARDLVRHRRWSIMRKIVFLPLALLVMAGVIIVPLIIISPLAAEWIFFGLSMASLAIVHSYIYLLYRELL